MLDLEEANHAEEVQGLGVKRGMGGGRREGGRIGAESRVGIRGVKRLPKMRPQQTQQCRRNGGGRGRGEGREGGSLRGRELFYFRRIRFSARVDFTGVYAREEVQRSIDRWSERASERANMKEKVRERERKKERKRETERERERKREREKERERERERGREREKERERERER